MRNLGRIGGQGDGGEDRPQEEPASQVARQQVRVLALPAQARRLCQGLFHDRRSIDKDLDLFAWHLLQQPAAKLFQPLLDQVVIIAPLGINADRRAVGLVQHGQRIVVGRVQLGQDDHRFCLWPQSGRIAAPMGPFGHPVHLAMPPGIQELLQPLGGLWDRIRGRDPHLGKSDRL